MSAEYIADRLVDELPDDMESIDDPCEDVRSGGWFFEVERKGKRYEVLVTQLVTR